MRLYSSVALNKELCCNLTAFLVSFIFEWPYEEYLDHRQGTAEERV